MSSPAFHSKEALYSIAAVFSVLPSVFVGLRVKARRKVGARLGWDDWAIVVALISCIALSITMIVDIKHGGLGTHIGTDAHGHVIRNSIFWTHLHANTAIRVLQVPTFGLTKLSVLLFYRRIFGHVNRVFDAVSMALFVVVLGWLVGFFVANCFECSNEVYLVQAYMDFGTDAGIVGLPLPLVWKLRLSTKKKFGVTCVFMLGTITTAASAWRAAIQHITVEQYHEGKGDADVTYILTPSVYSAVIEGALGIVGACLPLLRPLIHSTQIKHHFRWYGRDDVQEIPKNNVKVIPTINILAYEECEEQKSANPSLHDDGKDRDSGKSLREASPSRLVNERKSWFKE